jgi:hypothetical protein
MPIRTWRATEVRPGIDHQGKRRRVECKCQPDAVVLSEMQTAVRLSGTVKREGVSELVGGTANPLNERWEGERYEDHEVV